MSSLQNVKGWISALFRQKTKSFPQNKAENAHKDAVASKYHLANATASFILRRYMRGLKIYEVNPRYVKYLSNFQEHLFYSDGDKSSKKQKNINHKMLYQYPLLMILYLY